MLTEIESNLPPETEEVISQIIGAAIRVHSELGPGFLESIYAAALAIELESRRIAFEREKPIVVRYRGQVIAGQRLDFVVADSVVLESRPPPASTQSFNRRRSRMFEPQRCG